ncbi:hypothetical protein K474DRAFT_1662634 [Panus rudis PR-1116 ss-1]|nr:hypothetical protein K474DRAFT_1662634 [Panus rudis PR-1116 ss-1]
MSPVASSEYVPNMGKRDYMLPPVDLGFLYPDKRDKECPVSLWVKFVDEPIAPSARHWAIVWDVPGREGSVRLRAFRQLQVTRERDKQGVPCDHLTNWGPMTKSVTDDDLNRSRLIPLGDIGLAGRKRLEEIASTMPIHVPDGDWNNQHWIIAVLELAVQEGILNINVDKVRAQALSY